jgi:hypothetical protein
VAGSRDGSQSRESLFQFKKEINYVACGILAAWAVTAASPVIAAGQVERAHFRTSFLRLNKASINRNCILILDISDKTIPFKIRSIA